MVRSSVAEKNRSSLGLELMNGQRQIVASMLSTMTNQYEHM